MLLHLETEWQYIYQEGGPVDMSGAVDVASTYRHLWLTVSKAADRSIRIRADDLCLLLLDEEF